MANGDLNLGYIIEAVPPMPESWVIEVVHELDSYGIPSIFPAAFTPDQAREIARRIIAHYGPI